MVVMANMTPPRTAERHLALGMMGVAPTHTIADTGATLLFLPRVPHASTNVVPSRQVP